MYKTTLAKEKLKGSGEYLIAYQGVAAFSAFRIEQVNPCRDCIDILLIGLEG